MKHKCKNCGQELSEQNIKLACEDTTLPLDEIDLYCPSYSPETDTCPGYSKADQERSAYWQG